MLIPIKSGKVLVIGATKGEFDGENGKINYYKLAIAGSEGTCDMVSCSEDVFNVVNNEKFQKLKEYVLAGSYNTSNNRARWERLEA